MTAHSATWSAQPVPVFLSYSHRDEPWKERLKRALASLSQHRYITIWDDRKIPAGTAWEPEIEQHLREARIVLVLVTEDYVHSEWCLKELDIARSDQARRVIPLFVKRVALVEDDPIRALQGLPRDMNWADNWRPEEQNIPRALIADGILEEVHGLRRPGDSGSQMAVKAATAEVLFSLDSPKFVDRETQEREFNDFWDVVSSSRAGTAQIYLLPAADIDCPDYFLDRLHGDTIQRLAGSLKGTDKAAIHRVQVLREPRYQNLEVLKNDLARDLFVEFDAIDLWDRRDRTRLSAQPLAALDRFRLFTFILIEQTIHTDHAARVLPELLSWYVDTFWAGFHADAQVLVFLHLRYPAPPVPRTALDRINRLFRSGRSATASSSQAQLEAHLKKVFPEGRANVVPDVASAPVKVLPQLAPIQPDDIKNWLGRFFEPRHEIDITARRLFKEVLKESGDTRLSYFCDPLGEFYDQFVRTNIADRRLPQRAR
jgi:hypothetical protein